MGKDEELGSRVSALEKLYQEVSTKREELFFLAEKHQIESHEMKEQLNEIHQAIVGNTAMGHTGIIARMEIAEKRVTELEKVIDKLKVVIAQVGAIGGLIGAGLAFLINYLLKLF